MDGGKSLTMNRFTNDAEKMEFLKKYKLLPETASALSDFYYFTPGNDTPAVCEVIGYEAKFDTWAALVIKTDNEIHTIHSDYFSDMKKRGRAFHNPSSSVRKPKNSFTPYVVLDLETTGLSYKNDLIIEIAAIKCNAEGTSEFNKLIKINTPVPKNITQLTGITDEMLKDAESIETVLPAFLEFVGKSKLIGHNIKSFDILFLKKACLDLGLPEMKNKTVDTLHLARKALPALPNYKLSTICEHYTIDCSNAHRALADCYMCNECYKRLSSL